MRPIATSYNTQSGGSTRNQMTCGKLPGLLSYGVYGFIEKKIMVVVEIKKGRITPFCGIFGQQT